MNVKEVMKDYFCDLDEASKNSNRYVAWCTSVGPAEILRAMGFEVYFPENHGAMLGASRMTDETIPMANAYGYAPEICSYLTSDVGAYLKGVTPLTKSYGIASIPKPNVLVYSTNQCKDVMHWFDFFSKEFKAPIFGIHPPRYLPKANEADIEDVVHQFRALIVFLEKIRGKKLDEDRLHEVVQLSKETTDLWSEVLNLGQHKPSPFTFFDATIFMGPAVVLRGTQKASDYYRGLLQELKEKIKNQEPAVPEEKKRLYWEGMPVWGRLRRLSDLFKSNRANPVASTYCNSWIFDAFEPGDPLPGMALAYTNIFINRNDTFKEDYILDIARKFDIDGVVFHDAWTCPNNSNANYNLPNRLREKGLRSVVFDGDLNDLRCYSDEQVTTLIEAFLETL